MKAALVIHPRFYVYGGGELLCLYVCKILQEQGYHVKLVCDVFRPEDVERIYGMGGIMQKCEHIQVPVFKPFQIRGIPTAFALQRLMYARKFAGFLEGQQSDIVFSTQSSIYRLGNKEAQLYHFIYDIVDLFRYPETVDTVDPHMKGWIARPYYGALRILVDALVSKKPVPKWFFALADNVLQELHRYGYTNSSVIYPPCPLSFKPRPKKKQVIQVTRIVPQKRLEVFLEIARRLPEYDFIIVGRDNPVLQKFNPGYTTKLFADKPANVKYVESPIRDCPRLLEESQVYLYTGIEAGIGIALVEGIGAGCWPVAPNIGGGAEVIRACEIGSEFGTIEEAVSKTRTAMESLVDPWYIREHAKAFSPGVFEQNLRKVIP